MSALIRRPCDFFTGLGDRLELPAKSLKHVTHIFLGGNPRGTC
jgi:hypothetical protein